MSCVCPACVCSVSAGAFVSCSEPRSPSQVSSSAWQLYDPRSRTFTPCTSILLTATTVWSKDGVTAEVCSVTVLCVVACFVRSSASNNIHVNNSLISYAYMLTVDCCLDLFFEPNGAWSAGVMAVPASTCASPLVLLATIFYLLQVYHSSLCRLCCCLSSLFYTTMQLILWLYLVSLMLWWLSLLYIYSK